MRLSVISINKLNPVRQMAHQFVRNGVYRLRNTLNRHAVGSPEVNPVTYFIHGTMNNFLDTDKLAVPVWSCAALIVVIDLYYSNQEAFEEVN